MTSTHALSRTLLGLALTLAAACAGDDTGGPSPLDAGTAPEDDAGQDDASAGDAGGPLDDPLGRPGQWDTRFTIAGFSGQDGLAPQVYDFARAPSGEVLAAGYFSWASSQPIGPLVQRSDSGWTSWDGDAPASPGGLSAVAVGPEGQVAAAQYSGPFGGKSAHAVWLKDEAGVREIGTFEGTVRSLAFFGGQLWAAGFFGMEGGISSLAVWNGEAWQAPPGGGVDGPVYALSVDDDALFVGGGFTQLGGIEAHAVASWNGQAWTAHDLDNARVFAVKREAGELYAAGAGLGGVARLSEGGWEVVGGGLHQREQDTEGVASDIVFHQGDLYAIGCFGAAGGASEASPRVEVESIARWNGTRWEALSSSVAPVASSFFSFGVCGFEPNEYTLWDMTFQRLFSDGELVYVGGSFPGLGGVPSQSIVAYDGTDYVAQGERGDGLMGPASSVVAGGPNGAPYIFGGVSHAGGASSPAGVYRWDDGWQALGTSFPEGLTCFATAGGRNLAVTAAGDVFVGCSREEPEADPPCPDCAPVWPVILTLEDGAFRELPALDLPGAPDDLAVDGLGRLWVVGGARTGDASGAGWVARWDADHFTVVEDQFNSMVFRIAFAPGKDGGVPVVGGSFTQIGDAPHARIARWTGDEFEPVGSDLTTAVLALAAARDGTLYAATAAESETYFVLARWDESRWTELATPANGLGAPAVDTVYQVHALAAVGPRLIAGGSLLPAYEATKPFAEVERALFVFDGERFAALGGGVKASTVDSIAVTAEGAWFVGTLFAEAGSGTARRSSVGIAHWIWTPAP